MFDQYNSIALPWDQAITQEATRKFSNLTRLYRLPKSRLRDRVKRGAYYNRCKARRLLRKILQQHGLAVVFMCSQATNETQLGRLDADAVLNHLQEWHPEVARSQHFGDMANYLSTIFRGKDKAGMIMQLSNHFGANVMKPRKTLSI